MFSALALARARVSLPLQATRPRLIPAFRTIVTKRYTKEHESVAFDDATGHGIVGITDYAQNSLGDVVFVDLPEVGLHVSKGDSIGAVESVKAASDIVYYAPVSGEVVEINERLNKEPSLVNKHPDGQGWLFKIKLSDPKEFHNLLTPEAYAKTHDT